MYEVCAMHLEEALDEFVEEYEMAPDVHLLSAIKDRAESRRCCYCDKRPVYLVAPQTP